MALRWADRILETTTTTGTGPLALAGAITGYRRFADAPSMATSDTCYYSIYAVDSNGNPSGEWETGLGTYSATNQLTRTTPSASTNGGAAVNFGAGTKYVMLTPTANVLASQGIGGTSFPGSPGTGDKYYRTDRNVEYVYDGTRWLSVNTIDLTLAFTAVQPITSAGTQNAYAANPGYGVSGFYIDSYGALMLTATGSATIYFRLDLKKLAAGTVISSAVNTQSLTNNVWTHRSAAVGAVAASTDVGIMMTFEKIGGSPTSTYIAPFIRGRLIG